MKQVRLVQRKFAAGVPIPASSGSSSVAPLPPERKVEPTHPPKNCYHNDMSARSLLDIVSMQNMHKHQQEPLVVLERLRDDEIPAPPAPKVRLRLQKRGVQVNKDMCLRSGKRKPDSAKGSPRKRKIKKDLCLRSGKRKPNSTKGVEREERRRLRFAPLRRAGERGRATRNDKPLELGPPKKRKKLSSESTDDVPLMYYVRPNQAKPHPGHNPKATTVSEKDRAFTFKEPTKAATITGRRTLRTSSLRASTDRANVVLGNSCPSSPCGTLVLAPSPTLSIDFDVESSSGQDWCINDGIVQTETPDTVDTPIQWPQIQDPIKKENDNTDSQKGDSEPKLGAGKGMEELVAGNSEKQQNPKTEVAMVCDLENGKPVDETRKLDETLQKRPKRTVAEKVTAEPTEKNTIKGTRKKLAAKPSVLKMTKPKRGAKNTPEEVQAPTTRLLRNARESQPPNPDVYEFDAEFEASRPPSSLRRRGQATPVPAPPAPRPPSSESVEYVDILPTSSHCIQITPTKQQESGAECLSVSLVPKEDISIKKKKNMIENLSNSPALLNKLFNCLTAEQQNELDNFITAEGLNDQPSTSSTYLDQKTGSVYEALTFYPTAEEFADPIKYFDHIAPQASRYGLCKIVPPEGFKPPCNMSDSIRFAVIYQYISKMYSRWGPVSRELAAIKAHLRTQSVVFERAPLLDGSEVNLPKLYHAVERNGGLSNVIQRKRWGRVADEMKLSKLQHPERKLDPIYMRYLLPYATLSDQERQNIMADVEKCWTTKYQHMLERARNPFQRQNRMLGAEDSESDDEGEDGHTVGALHEAEDCIVQGRVMNLVTFKKIATTLMDAHFEPNKQPPSAIEVEKAYWRAVLLGTEHIVANTASIDTGEEGYGFPKDPETEYGTHPWNLKVLARNPNNVLRYLGSVLGVTVPTLHMSMLFSTSCWHRDPHGLPWTEYMHSGAEKIWYGIPRDESANFRRAVETLCPAYCQNKSIWLASEITMVPPNILSEHGVKLSRLLQRPGEYVLVFPEAHSCSITTGFGISESVYFASNGWLSQVYKLFQELRKSCEPTMFSLEQLLLAGSADSGAPQEVCSVLCTLLSAELEHRRALEHKGIKVKELPASAAPLNTSYFRAWNTRDQDECEYCRSTLFFSKVTGLTGRKTAVCPEHALCLLETKKHKKDQCVLECHSSHSTCVLEDMLERLERASSEETRAPSVIDLTGPEFKRSMSETIAEALSS